MGSSARIFHVAHFRFGTSMRHREPPGIGMGAHTGHRRTGTAPSPIARVPLLDEACA